MNHGEQRGEFLGYVPPEEKDAKQISSDGKASAEASGEINVGLLPHEKLTEIVKIESEDSIDIHNENAIDEWLVYVEENTPNKIPEPVKKMVTSDDPSKKMNLKEFAKLLISTMESTSINDIYIINFLQEKLESQK